MEQTTSQIIGHILNILTSHITKHLGYVTSSTKHVTDMRNKMKVLEGKSDDIKRHLKKNKRDNKEIPARVEGWLGEVENVKNKVESISSYDIGCLHIKMRYRAGKNAFKTFKDIERLINEENTIKWSDSCIPLGRVDSKPTSPSPSPSGKITQNDFESRNEEFTKALKFLQQDDKASQVIALCGMGGVGKTTMMEQLKKVAEDNKMFRWIAKAVVGQNVNILSIQKDIAVYLGDGDLPEASKAVRADHLYKKFVKLSEANEKTLVILDDVWEKIELKEIGLRNPLPNGVKLLLTSRDSNVCTQIAFDADSVLRRIKVDVLEEIEAQNFFSQTTRVSKEDDLDKYLIGCDIVKKCGYLPLAIKLIASTLRSKENHEWKNALNRLKNYDLDKNVQEIIKISYEYIEKDEDKQIFLHCGLFPEDYNIPIEDLTRYAWGLKLLKNVSNLKEARDRTNTSVDNLLNANLLIKSNDVGFVKMHDLVLAFVLGISNGDLEWIISHGDVFKWDGNEMGKSCKRISLTCRGVSEFPRDSKYPNLSLLQLMHGDKSLAFPEDFYENMGNLEVVSYYELQYPPFPTSLTNLKSLCLNKCNLMFDCSFVGYLENLEVLSFADCGIRKLPSKIGNLKRLRLLDLTGCVDLRIDDGVFKNLENLEELYMRVSNRKAIRFTDANFEEMKMLSYKLCALEVEFIKKNTWLESLSFDKLDKFKISLGCLLETEEYIETYLFKKTLKLVTERKRDLLDCRITDLFKKTEKLHLEVKDMIGLEDVISIHHYDQRTFSYLRDLTVSNCVNLKYLFPMCVASSLRKLERLTVSSCSVLEALVNDNGSEINEGDENVIRFEELKFLILEMLPELERLFPVDNVVELPQLVELEVNGLPKFTSIYSNCKNVSESQHLLLNSQVRIPELKKLMVTSMENLTQIWACSSEEDFNNISMLREIRVYGCNSLVNLFPTNPMRLLSHLEMLTIIRCGSIEVIFNIDLGDVGHEVAGKSSLRAIYVDNSEKVREVWRIKGGENNSTTTTICGFEAVERICISGCKMFRNVFTPDNTKFDMRADLDISISDCEEIKGRNNELINVMSSEETPQVVENSFNVAFPSSQPNFPHHLSELVLRRSETLEVVFEINNNNNGELTTQQDTKQLFPNLKGLRLERMERLTHVWKCKNWNKLFLIQSSFHNLTTIRIRDCNKIKHLFSPLMAKLLSNLKEIVIRKCEGIEELVHVNSNTRDEEGEMTTTSTYTTHFFPHLQHLFFQDLGNLKRIGGGGEFKFSSRRIYIYSCDALSSVIPSYAVGQMQNLQVLEVRNCESLIEVFETQGIYNNNACSSTNSDEGNTGTNYTLILENINVPQLSNLKELVLSSCNLLQHAFTFSTLESLKQLKELSINNCEAMKVIVKNEDREQIKDMDFPRLKSFELINLPNLEGFFFGKNGFEWPLLEKFKIGKCPKMKVFTSGRSTAQKLKYMHTSLGKHSLGCGLNFHLMHDKIQLPGCSESSSTCSPPLEPLPTWFFHNLIELHMEYSFDKEVKTIIPSNELLQLQMLERIRLVCCVDVEEVFGEPQSVVEIANLTQVELSDLHSLKYIWKSNHQYHVLKFPNLTTLSIDRCDKLEYVFTSSMVGSLLQLQDLHIRCCNELEVIVKEEQKEVESEIKCDDKLTKIILKLPCLKSLKLEGLQNLKGFCLGKDDFSWPSLRTLEIKGCPKVAVFTEGYVDTPALNIIDTSFGRCYIREEDINSFIKTKQDEDFSF